MTIKEHADLGESGGSIGKLHLVSEDDLATGGRRYYVMLKSRTTLGREIVVLDDKNINELRRYFMRLEKYEKGIVKSPFGMGTGPMRAQFHVHAYVPTMPPYRKAWFFDELAGGLFGLRSSTIDAEGVEIADAGMVQHFKRLKRAARELKGQVGDFITDRLLEGK